GRVVPVRPVGFAEQRMVLPGIQRAEEPVVTRVLPDREEPFGADEEILSSQRLVPKGDAGLERIVIDLERPGLEVPEQARDNLEDPLVTDADHRGLIRDLHTALRRERPAHRSSRPRTRLALRRAVGQVGRGLELLGEPRHLLLQPRTFLRTVAFVSGLAGAMSVGMLRSLAHARG